MKKRMAICMLLVCSGLNAQDTNNDFDTYRKNVFGGYNSFRKTVLENYASYLSGIWKEYHTFRGIKVSDIPKPISQPIAPDNVSPAAPLIIQPNEPPAVPVSVPIPSAPVIKPVPEPVTVPPVQTPMIGLQFYGLELQLPKFTLQSSILQTLSPKAITDCWISNSKSEEIAAGIKMLSFILQKYSFNDWCTYLLVKEYVEKCNPTLRRNAQITVEHFLLANLGYDIRLAKTEDSLLLLIPFKQTVFTRSFLVLENKKYYIFPQKEIAGALSTYEIPKKTDLGQSLDLVFHHPILLPKKEQTFSRSRSDIHITGKVNSNLIRLMSDYPLMSIPDYAMSNPSMNTRQEVIRQLKIQVQGKTEQEAVNIILSFVQKAFQYKTDEEQFGSEKPFFFEEMLYYPYCDCEDRAIFYTYLIRTILNLDCHLLYYPGHESVAVSLSSPIEGDGYVYKGRNFYISDPTYIGSRTGQCMPEFRNMKPEIQLWY